MCKPAPCGDVAVFVPCFEMDLLFFYIPDLGASKPGAGIFTEIRYNLVETGVRVVEDEQGGYHRLRHRKPTS